MAPVFDGLVHDARYPDLILPPAEFVAKAFSGQDVEVSLFDNEGEVTFEYAGSHQLGVITTGGEVGP